ncbi:MAG: replication-associated recombination protein A, partial [Verrucomicrobiia bacterium]
MPRNDLFSAEPKPEPLPAADRSRHQPLAARMRPRTLSEFVGQTHILGPGQLLRRAIEADRIQSLIFFG